MQFSSDLTEATLLHREKSYLVEVALGPFDKRWVYCPNVNELFGVLKLGSRIWFSTSDNPRRKYRYTWEVAEVDGGELVFVNAEEAPLLVKEAIENSIIPCFNGATEIQLSKSFSDNGYTADLVMEVGKNSVAMMIETVTMGDEIHRGFTPDCISSKNIRALKTLLRAKESGMRAVLFYSVQHTGIDKVFPADHVDPAYGQLLRYALSQGVEVMAYGIEIDSDNVSLVRPVPVVIPLKTPKLA